ncbi:hypothetical protein HPB48_015305 [Haemaphysalis longicornis]|uniref:Uncharacterized protein n=1 Tax=Haemaphysalis longicornis TaxID=44386 RepID=A0A9J6GJ93_HAELO|nr:hypothetical protein HPB48_015305 [Haemaphysalis longicornis]
MNSCIRDLVLDPEHCCRKGAPREPGGRTDAGSLSSVSSELDIKHACAPATPDKTFRRLPYSFYYALLGCYSNALVNCNGTQAHQLVATLAENVFGQTLGLVCGVYTRGSPSCEALPALDRVDPSELETDSFILPLVTLANRLKYSRVVRVQHV